MSAYDVQVLVFVLIGLLVWCSVYALILAAHPHWYLPNNKTWVTVLLGVIWVLIALAILVYFGLFDLGDFGIVTICFSVAGAPMVFWQYIQDARHRATLRASRNNSRRGNGDGAED